MSLFALSHSSLSSDFSTTTKRSSKEDFAACQTTTVKTGATRSFRSAHNNDSGMGEQPATHDPSSTPKEPKTELPTPVVAHIVPKSEAPRKAADKVCDQDGFWIDSSDDENDFVQVAKLTPKGCKNILSYLKNESFSF